ncbi:hypothetical protein ONJ87_25210, partial [Salmonella enterica subsp. enterica serovar Anatum]|nr:hypothetical protein [Salmonella enterica subsp. enterica serovar Anatum]
SYTVNIRRYCHLKVRARFIGQIIAGDTAVVNQFNTVNGDMRVVCSSDLVRCGDAWAAGRG